MARIDRNCAIGFGRTEEDALRGSMESAKQFLWHEEEHLTWLCDELREAMKLSSRSGLVISLSGTAGQNRYDFAVKTKAIVASAVVFVVLLFVFMLFTLARHPPQDITVRHVGSVQSGNITTMTFEVRKLHR